jgi:hypothetical protein
MHPIDPRSQRARSRPPQRTAPDGPIRAIYGILEQYENKIKSKIPVAAAPTRQRGSDPFFLNRFKYLKLQL